MKELMVVAEFSIYDEDLEVAEWMRDNIRLLADHWPATVTIKKLDIVEVTCDG